MVLCSETRGRGGLYRFDVRAEVTATAIMEVMLRAAKGQSSGGVLFCISWRSSGTLWRIQWGSESKGRRARLCSPRRTASSCTAGTGRDRSSWLVWEGAGGEAMVQAANGSRGRRAEVRRGGIHERRPCA